MAAFAQTCCENVEVKKKFFFDHDWCRKHPQVQYTLETGHALQIRIFHGHSRF